MSKQHFYKDIKIFSAIILSLLGCPLYGQGSAFLSGDTGTGATTWVNTGDVAGTGILYYSSTVADGLSTGGTYLNTYNTWTNNVTTDPDLGKVYPTIGFRVQYPGQTAAGWPMSRTTESADIWFQYYATPSTTNDIHVNKISFSLLALGTGNFTINAYYSTDPTFATRTQIVTSKGIGASVFTDFSATGLDVVVKSGQKLYLRIYPWYSNNPNSTSKYLVMKNVNFVTSGSVADLTNSKLTSLKTNGASVVGFSAATTTYTVPLLYGTTQVPLLTAVADDPKATISINNAASAPGTSIVVVTAQDKSTTTYTVNFTEPTVAPQLAFPGAEGYGKYTVGGRGGTIYEVTNLNDDGLPGSLRYAVNQSGPRTVVFKVSGTIVLNSNLTISNPYITIAGQTAPGDGICLRKYSLVLDGANNVIIRYIRVRFGDETKLAQDAISGRGATNIILDHVSASWSIDETMSVYFCDNITVQWCLVAESLYNSYHTQDGSTDATLAPHGFGGIWGSNNSTYHHNLMAHHSSRNPRISSGCGYFDYRNNVVYNWGYNSTYGGENVQPADVTHAFSQINMIANYYKPGPATTPGGISYRLVNPSYRTATTDYGKWFIDKNVMVGNGTITDNNWAGSGVQPSGGAGDFLILKLTSPWVSMPINQQTATAAYYSVLDNVGASLPRRDSVDMRIVDNTLNGNATFEGTYNQFQTVPDKSKKCGIIDSQTDVGGWPKLNSTTAPVDTDHDGMPDVWETAHGLNPNDAADRNKVATDGYTMVEKYLNGIEFSNPVTGYELKKLSSTSFQLNWKDNYLAEDGFIVERSNNGVDFVTVATLPQFSNTYVDNTVTSESNLVYRVVAFNADNTTPRTTSIAYGVTAVGQVKANKKVSCYPNPFTDKLCVNIPYAAYKQQVNIKIYDLVGHLVACSDNKIKISDDIIEWSDDALGSLNPGGYVGVFQIGEQKIGNIKLFKIR